MRLALACVAALVCAAVARAEIPPAEAYQLHCSGCHGPEGRGAEGVVPSFGALPEILATPAGRTYLVRVPGVAHAPLPSDRLAVLLDWLVARHAPGVEMPPYEVHEVERLRADPLRDPVAARPVR